MIDKTKRLLFEPAIYDYKSTLANQPLHHFGQNLESLVAALQKELSEISADIVTVGYDIYNIEAEAIGATVERSEEFGMPKIKEPLLKNLKDAGQLQCPEKPSGRMNLFIEAARQKKSAPAKI